MIGRLAIAMALAAECLVVYCVAELFAAGYDDHRRAVPGVSWVFLGFVAFGLTRLTGYFDVGVKARVLASVVITYIAVAAVLRIEFAGDIAVWDFGWAWRFIEGNGQSSREFGPVFMTLFLVIVLWVRCAVRAVQEVDLDGLPRTVAPGFAITTILVILGAMTDRTGEIGRAAAAFFAVAVLALAFAQMALSGATIGDLRAGEFTGTLMGAVLGVTAAGVALFMITFGLIWPAISPFVVDAVANILTAILIPPTWLLAQLFELLFSLFGVHNLQIQPTDLRSGAEEATGGDPSMADRVRGFSLRIGALLALVGVAAAVAVIFSVVRRKAGPPSQTLSARSAAGGLAEDMRGLFRTLFRRGSGRDRTVALGPVARLYADVLQEASSAGRPRDPAETPIEFAPVVAGRLHAGPVTDEITSAFVQAAYAGRPPDETTIAELEQRWARARQERQG